ncbi:MAG: phytanoyl-CoA dioxygenase family protein [bacterium]|nr:phytanoyl-CoA dioxygenase family protein [bacterium]
MTSGRTCRLLVVPGSHLGQIWDHYQGDEFVGAVADPAFDPSGAVPIELKAGSISIHHIRLLHGSAPNTSTLPRHLLLFAYSAADSWPLSGVTDPDSYNEQMLRGTPPRAPRLEKVPIGPIPRRPDPRPCSPCRTGSRELVIGRTEQPAGAEARIRPRAPQVCRLATVEPVRQADARSAR